MGRVILLVQHDSTNANAVQEVLAGPPGLFRVQRVASCAAALKRLAETGDDQKPNADDIAAILLDLYVTDSCGIETFDCLYHAAQPIPIVILVDPPHEDIAKLAVQRGAQGYLLAAALDSNLLEKTVTGVIEQAAKAEALFEERERARVTLDSIGDAVISTDLNGHVTYLNGVAAHLTGWSYQEAAGHPVREVLNVLNATTREEVGDPMAFAIRENKVVALAPNCVLIRRDGVEAGIEDSTAPIHDRRGRVTGAVMVFHDVSATRALSLRMSYLAQHDSLTDLPNRILLNDRLTQAMALARRHHQQLAVLFLDLDRFKHINDSLGHDIGDRLLQSVAQRLLTCVRSSDTVSRQGGDEFVILLAEVAHARDAAVSAEKILLALGAPHGIDKHALHISASIGIATYPEDGTEAEVLMKNADFAMYHAKENGRNNYQFFKPEMNTRALQRQSIENGLRHAIERHELSLHYQPKMNLKSGAITGVEALIRWQHPTLGLVSPEEFIPIAEECGFIVTLGRWVLHEACRQLQAWRGAGLPLIRIAINVSAVELRDKDFVANVQATLARTGVASHCLELELTETFLVQDSSPTTAVLNALSELGVRITLDDFGTGYSSLSHLRRFPINTVKIDRLFLRRVTTDDEDASMVSAVIRMGKSLHIRVVAEGVETAEQLAFLKKRGCREGQGYYFSHPLAANDFTRFLERSIADTEVA